jgi:hypothetical protein
VNLLGRKVSVELRRLHGDGHARFGTGRGDAEGNLLLGQRLAHVHDLERGREGGRGVEESIAGQLKRKANLHAIQGKEEKAVDFLAKNSGPERENQNITIREKRAKREEEGRG